jgi:hypothetical protein
LYQRNIDAERLKEFGGAFSELVAANPGGDLCRVTEGGEATREGRGAPTKGWNALNVFPPKFT